MHWIPITDLTLCTPENQNTVRRLLEDIPHNGIVNPVQVVQCTVQEAKDRLIQAYGFSPVVLDDLSPDTEIKTPVGGANRVRAAQLLGFTHVPAEFMDWDSAVLNQINQRTPYAHWWNRGTE